MRAALAGLLEKSEAFEVVAHADGRVEAVRYANGHKPDVAIVGPYVAGADLPGQFDGSDGLISAIRAVSAATRFCMVVDGDHGADDMASALDAGVHGIVSVDAQPAEFIEAAGAIAAGSVHMPPALAVRMLTARRDETGPGLSPRETEVLKYVALGYTNNEIAGLLHLSVRTVETHRGHLSSKLSAHSRADLVRWALDRGLLR